MPEQRRILLGICGGIAAFKAVALLRLLRAAECEVRCILTPAAEAFVAPLTLEVLSGRDVWREEYLNPGHDGRELHILASEWDDVLVVAPATAHFMARLSLGLADDFLTTTALAWDGPVVLAPAMHARMWKHPTTQEHRERLDQRSVEWVGPAVGPLASGDEGIGRMSEPEEIASVVLRHFRQTLVGRRVLVTAGPTQEPLDPVRFLSNRSSGRMGFAMAQEAARRGASTLLITGPVELPTPSGVERIDVRTAEAMNGAVQDHAASSDVVVMAAAVADFRPTQAADQKLKKRGGAPSVELSANPDILAGLTETAPGALRVGFAAETESLESEAKRKLDEKQLHLIVANDVSRSEVGFGSDQNEVTVLDPSGDAQHLPRTSKARLAQRLWDRIEQMLVERSGGDAATTGG